MNYCKKVREESCKLTVSLSYQCFTTNRAMKNLQLCHSLLAKHDKYEFSISKKSHHVSEMLSPESTDFMVDVLISSNCGFLIHVKVRCSFHLFLLESSPYLCHA
ncbi:hypothetical protein ES319_D01G228000v1 [Gossypium barbadense]|uniref:Uncharacterized protein n=2 Tax=Gossypium TaxID=3633 RepID=A0A5J5SRX9_GOSBA|nr:hypothetical protein ES319_D01G228000v1 [Gossypium barbadense]TYG84368.1 hypothetical protein ES288_D01G244000v1 [Gossypium darwinii]